MEPPNVTTAKFLHPNKVIVWSAESVKGIYLKFFDSTFIGQSYAQLLETKFFQFTNKSKNFT